MGSNHKAHPADAVLPTDAIVVVVFDDAQLPLQQPLDAAAHLVHVRKLLEREHRPLALRIVLLARNVRRPRGALGHAVVVASILVEYLPPLAATHQRHRVNRHRLVPQRLLRCVHELRLEETPHDQHPRCRQRIGLRQRLGNGTEGTMVYGTMKLVQVALVSRLCQHGVHLLQLLHRDRNLGRPHLAEHLHARLVLAALGKRGGQHPPSRLPVRLPLADAVLPLRSEFGHGFEKREEREAARSENTGRKTQQFPVWLQPTRAAAQTPSAPAGAVPRGLLQVLAFSGPKTAGLRLLRLLFLDSCFPFSLFVSAVPMQQQ